MFLIIAAIRQEISDFKAKLSDISGHEVSAPGRFYQGLWSGRQVGLFLTSVAPGAEKIATGLSAVCQRFPVSAAVVTGFAGGLVPGFSPGDLAIADDVVARVDAGGRDSSQIFHSDPALLSQAVSVAIGLDRSYRVGRALSSATVLASVDKKRHAGEAYGAIAVDMENFHVAAALSAAKVPFVIARSIFDPLEAALPPTSITEMVDAEGNVQLGNALKLLATPKDILKIPEFARRASLARASMTEFLLNFVTACTI